MTPRPDAPPRRSPARVLVLGLAVVAGCQTLRVGDKAEKPEPLEVRAPQPMPTPPLPGKHSLRVSQYVFNADFEAGPAFEHGHFA